MSRSRVRAQPSTSEPDNRPVNTVPPLLTFADPFVGTIASCSDGTWTNSPTGFTYQWLRNGASISGATTSFYILDNADVGTTITCRVTATNASGSRSAVSSNSILVQEQTEIALDPPVTLLDTSTQHAYGVDRMVEGYTGNTIRVERSSDNAQDDFGFSATTGIFDLLAVQLWSGGSDVKVVRLYDQKGSINLDVAGGDAALITTGAVSKFAATYNPVNGQLIRSGTDGGLGINMGGNCYFTSGASLTNFDTTGGFDVTLLWSQNERKISSGEIPDGAGGNSDDEDLFILDSSGSSFFRNRIGAGSGTDSVSLSTPGGTEVEASVFPYKRDAQQVATFEVKPTEMTIFRYGGADVEPVSAAIQSDIEAAVFDTSVIKIGDTNASRYPNIVLGGFILSQPYTPQERYLVHSKLNTIGQQHRRKSTSDILAYFDEIVTLKDINTTTGVATGQKGNLTLNFNTSVVPEGTPDWTFDYVHPIAGLQGVRSGTKFNRANGFKATDTYFSGTATGSMMAIHIGEDHDNDLTQMFAQADGSQFDESENFSLACGFDHGSPSARMEISRDKDDDDLIGTRRRADETLFGTNPYDFANQAMGKYNRNVAHVRFTYNEIFSGHTWDEASWKNQSGTQPYNLDAPVVAPSADNFQYRTNDNHLVCQFVTFQQGAGYNLSDDYATRKPERLTSTNISYISDGPTPIGHKDCSIAINPNGANVHSTDNAFIMTQNGTNVERRPYFGTRFAMGFAKVVWTPTQVEEIQVNLYKLLT